MQDDNLTDTSKKLDNQTTNQNMSGLTPPMQNDEPTSSNFNPQDLTNPIANNPLADNLNPIIQNDNLTQPNTQTTTPDPNEAIQTQNIKNVVVAPHAPKKYGGNKIIATIFGFVLLIAGVTAGVYLVQRQQQISKEAASGKECSQSPDCILLDNPGNSGTYTAPRIIKKVSVTAQDYFYYNPGDTNDGCYHVIINASYLSWNRVGSGPDCKDISNVQVWLGEAFATNTPTQTPSPTPPPCKYCEAKLCKTRSETCNSSINECSTNTDCGTVTNTPTQTPTLTPTIPPEISADCLDVKAYDTNWNQISLQELGNLKAGEKIRFTVSGETPSGSFDKARFTVNNNLVGETSNKKPGTDVFYIEYEIPENTYSFNVKGEIHHTSLGWI